MDNRKEYSVTMINQYIKSLFMNEYVLSAVLVRGEVSNCKYHSSGHIYFTLKDKNSSLACVMFRGKRRGLNFALEDGMEVVVGGSINVYEQTGRYQLYAEKIDEVGSGSLAVKFEQLKKELAAKGYFDEDRKIPLPRFAKKVGIVTASTGAAIQDICSVAYGRNPYVELILYPAQVQGEGAAESIARGIRYFDKHDLVDVLIVGRGGGSSEDLWAFNEEVVADAIYECRIPVISAVGHEVDFSISDFVADKRAETPTAAANMAVYDLSQLETSLNSYRDYFAKQLANKTDYLKEVLVRYAKQIKYLSPQNQIIGKRQSMIDLEDKLVNSMDRIIKDKKYQLGLLSKRLDGLSPLKRLEAGYAYVSDEDNKRIASVDDVSKGDLIDIHLVDGRVLARAEDIKPGRQ